MEPGLTITKDEKTGMFHGEFITQNGDIITFKSKLAEDLAHEFKKSMRIYMDWLTEHESKDVS